ncbi:MAG: flagellar filament capping protein FliD [Ignavibacteria bacterium]|jgi:flagellar hook-associated protein 2|nr:flagellar filament capping protein FliD [Ignavibacteria bacterium]MCU7502564.1 flagellar filament capping protein FliD [Ignavibacteria bacterium]MCU7515233.1 flagellar filament capping protein FliD [Ignavibacteria bacterium]
MAVDALTSSGIDSLVSSYTASEQSRMITPLTTRKSSYESKISTYSTLSSKLDSLKSLISDLKATGSSSLFVPSMTATLSNSSFMSVSATSKATAGSYTMRVQQLAKNDITVSKQDASSAAKLANGTYNFQIVSGGTTKDVSVTIDDTVTDFKGSLQKIKDAINSQASEVVSAAAFSPDSSTSRLSMTAKNMGQDNRIILQQKDSTSSEVLSYLGYSLNSGTPAQVERDTTVSDGSSGYIYDSSSLNAKFNFNGLDFQRNSNTINDVVDGLTFTLTSEMKDTDANVNISVSGSTSSVRSKIENFVTKFNEIYYYLKTNSSTTTTSRGALAGDATTNSLLQSMTQAAYTRVDGLSSDKPNRLGDLGISFTATGGLSISDSAKLDSKIANNLGDVEAIFNSTNGIATTLYGQLDRYLGTEGYLAKANESYSNTVSDLASKITAKQASIDKSAEVLRSKYEALQTQLASLLTTSSWYSGSSSTDTTSYF